MQYERGLEFYHEGKRRGERLDEDRIDVSRFVYMILSFVFVFSFVFAAHVITTSTGGTSYSVDEDVVNLYNITVNNTDLLLEANITEVNITIPSSFTFVVDTNDTDAGAHTFSNTTTVLSWDNDGLVMNLTSQYFWFNATSATPGSYNLTVTTTNSTSTLTTNLSVTVNDTTAPDVTFLIPAINSVFNVSNVIEIAANVSDNVLVDVVLANITYPNGTVNQLTLSNTSSMENGLDAKYNVSFTIPNVTGTYNITIISNDTSNNINSSETSNFTVNDITAPVWVSVANWSSANNQNVSILLNATDNVAIDTYTVNDSNFEVNSSNYLVNITALSVGVYLLNLTVNDTSGNEAYRLVSVTMTAVSSTTTDDSSSSSSSSSGVSSKALSLGETFGEVKFGIKYLFNIGNESHHLYLRSVSTVKGEAKIDVYSLKTTVFLQLNESQDVDLDEDGTYDIIMQINKIYTGRTAIDLSVRLFDESTVAVNETSSGGADINGSVSGDEGVDEDEGGVTSSLWFWIIVVIVLVLVAVAAVSWYLFGKNVMK